MRPQETAKQLELRRHKAIRLLKRGKNYRQIAKELGCCIASIHQWKTMYEQSGAKGLKSRPHKGREPQLSLQQKKELANLLLKGSRAHGWIDDFWTLKRIAAVIEREFGVKYHYCHVWRIMTGMGWSCQKPERVAREQDKKKVKEFREKIWPKIKEEAKGGKKDSHLPR